MQLRRLLTGGIWLATTVAATGMVWAATSVVAGDVTDRPARVIAQREVVEALQEQAPVPVTQPAVTPSQPPPPTVPSRPVATTPPVESKPPPPDPGTTLPPPSTTTSTTVTTVPPTTAPTLGATATFRTTGGVVTVTCAGYFIGLDGATPADGYAVEVLDRGPATVDVHFVGRGAEDRLRAVCFANRAIRIPDQHQTSAPTGASR